jgi:hypothetical protein
MHVLVKLPTGTYNQEMDVIVQNALILNTIHNIFNLRDTEEYKFY